MVISQECLCGVRLRYDKDSGGYIPVAGSWAAKLGHWPSVLVKDGMRSPGPRVRACEAPVSLDAAREAKAGA